MCVRAMFGFWFTFTVKRPGSVHAASQGVPATPAEQRGRFRVVSFLRTARAPMEMPAADHSAHCGAVPRDVKAGR